MIDVDALPLDDGDTIQSISKDLYITLFEVAYEDAAGTLGFDLDFDLANDRIQDILDELLTQVKDIAETTKQEIKDLIERAAATGLSVDDLALQLAELEDIRSLTRAQTIARTETANAYNAATLTAYRDGGVTRVRVLDSDNDTACRNADGQIWTIEEALVRRIEHPNCARGFQAIIDEAEE